jgi:hypothetical protein
VQRCVVAAPAARRSAALGANASRARSEASHAPPARDPAASASCRALSGSGGAAFEGTPRHRAPIAPAWRPHLNFRALPARPAPAAAPRRLAPPRSEEPADARVQRTLARARSSTAQWARLRRTRCWAVAAPTRRCLAGTRARGARGETRTGCTGGLSTSRSQSLGAQPSRPPCRRATPPLTCSHTRRATALVRAAAGCWRPATPPSSSARRLRFWRLSARSPPSLWASAPCASCATVSAPYSLSRPSCAC